MDFSKNRRDLEISKYKYKRTVSESNLLNLFSPFPVSVCGIFAVWIYLSCYCISINMGAPPEQESFHKNPEHNFITYLYFVRDLMYFKLYLLKENK